MKSILLATDGSEYALRSAYYLADLYKGESDLEITVLNVSPRVPPLYREERHDPLIRKDHAAWKKRKEEEAKKYIERVVEVLLRGGFKKSHIKTKHPHQTVGVARDIVREADVGHHDACVVGKKGMGWFDDIFLGSITRKLLEISENHPVWLVSGKEWQSRKVLIAMDNTGQSVQLARYVGEMLHGLKGVQIHFYHHCVPFTEDSIPEKEQEVKEIEQRIVEHERVRMANIFDEAREVLKDSGFDTQLVDSEFCYDASSPIRKAAKGVLEQVRLGKYGTLVVGRKGATSAREFRLGSVALRVAVEAQDCAVWVV